jgi:hypothetical protein
MGCTQERRLFTDEFYFGGSGAIRGWWLDSSTLANAYLANDSCLLLLLQILRFGPTTKVTC